MNPASAVCAIGAAFVVCLSLAAGAAAQPGQTPPAEQTEPAAQPTPPEKPQCIKDDSGFRTEGKRNVFMVELTNQCEQRLRCTVRAYIVNSRGPVSGQATLTLAPKSKGPAAHKTHAIVVKEAGGMANTSRDCKAI